MAGFKIRDIKLVLLALLSVLFICLLLNQLGVFNKKQENSLERFNNYPIERFQTSTSNSPECDVSFDESTGTLTITNCSVITEQRLDDYFINRNKNKNNIKKVILPENLTIIDKDAFLNFEELREVVIKSDSKFECELYAFYNCKKLHIFPWKNLKGYNNIVLKDFAFENTGFIHINHINNYNLDRLTFRYCSQLRQMVIDGEFINNAPFSSNNNNNLNTLVYNSSNIDYLNFYKTKSNNMITQYVNSNYVNGDIIRLPTPFEIVDGTLQLLRCNNNVGNITLPSICNTNNEMMITTGNCRKDYKLVKNGRFHNHLIPENFKLETQTYKFLKIVPNVSTTTTGGDSEPHYKFDIEDNEENATVFAKEENDDGSISLKVYDENSKTFRYFYINWTESDKRRSEDNTIQLKENKDNANKLNFIYSKGNTILIKDSQTTNKVMSVDGQGGRYALYGIGWVDMPTNPRWVRADSVEDFTLRGVYPPLSFKLKTNSNKYISFNQETPTVSGDSPQFYNRQLHDTSDNADTFNLVRNRNGTACLKKGNQYLTINDTRPWGGVTFTDVPFDGSNRIQISEFTIRYLPDSSDNSKVALEVNFTNRNGLKINTYFKININDSSQVDKYLSKRKADDWETFFLESVSV